MPYQKTWICKESAVHKIIAHHYCSPYKFDPRNLFFKKLSFCFPSTPELGISSLKPVHLNKYNSDKNGKRIKSTIVIPQNPSFMEGIQEY